MKLGRLQGYQEKNVTPICMPYDICTIWQHGNLYECSVSSATWQRVPVTVAGLSSVDVPVDYMHCVLEGLMKWL